MEKNISLRSHSQPLTGNRSQDLTELLHRRQVTKIDIKSSQWDVNVVTGSKVLKHYHHYTKTIPVSATRPTIRPVYTPITRPVDTLPQRHPVYIRTTRSLDTSTERSSFPVWISPIVQTVSVHTRTDWPVDTQSKGWRVQVTKRPPTHGVPKVTTTDLVRWPGSEVRQFQCHDVGALTPPYYHPGILVSLRQRVTRGPVLREIVIRVEVLPSHDILESGVPTPSHIIPEDETSLWQSNRGPLRCLWDVWPKPRTLAERESFPTSTDTTITSGYPTGRIGKGYFPSESTENRLEPPPL